MTSIDRTVYRRVKRSYTTKELIEAYTPTKEERHFVETMTRSQNNQLNLMLWLKLFPCLGYFPSMDEIPFTIVIHVRKALSLPEELVPAYDTPRTLSRHHQQGFSQMQRRMHVDCKSSVVDWPKKHWQGFKLLSAFVSLDGDDQNMLH